MKIFVPFDESVLDELSRDVGMGLVPYQVGYRCIDPRNLLTGNELNVEAEAGWLDGVVG